MKVALIASHADPASMNLKERLLELFDFKKNDEEFEGSKVFSYKNFKLYTRKEKNIHAEGIDKKIEADFFVFLTRHIAKDKVPAITCHVPGNFGAAEYGGKEKTLGMGSAVYLKELFKEINKVAAERKFEKKITLEVTHHGPCLEKPCLFIEVGSSAEHWQDKDSAEADAIALINTFSREYDATKYKIAIGFGGQHYPGPFNRRLLTTNIALCHICPKYALKFLDKNMVLEMVKKTKEKVDFALVDWKGLGIEKQRVVKAIEEAGLEIVRTEKV